MEEILNELNLFEEYLIKNEYLENSSGKSYYTVFEIIEFQGVLHFSICKEKFPILKNVDFTQFIIQIFNLIKAEKENIDILVPWMVLTKKIPIDEKSSVLIDNLGIDGFENKFSKYISLLLIFRCSQEEEKNDIEIIEKEFTFRIKVGENLNNNTLEVITKSLKTNLNNTLVILQVRDKDNYEEYLETRKIFEETVLAQIPNPNLLENFFKEERI